MKKDNKKLKIVTIIQARMSSSRLPGKVLMPLAGLPLLLRLYERVNHSELAGKIIVAVTTDPQDKIIVDLCSENQINFYIGNPTDLLDRHYQAARMFNADAVVKIPSDCPLIDPVIIDKVIGYFLDNYYKYDYVSNLHPPTWPDGNDVEIMKMNALETAWKESNNHSKENIQLPIFGKTRSDSILGIFIGKLVWIIL